MSLLRAGPALTALGCAVSACTGGPSDDASGPFDIHLADTSTIVTTESGLLGQPSALAVDPNGRIWVADYQAKTLLRVESDGSRALTVGREGKGPGEFGGPSALAIGSDFVRVIDAGNRRITDFTLDGVHVSDYPALVLMLYNGAVGLDGRYVTPVGNPLQNALAVIHTLYDGSEVSLGPAVEPMSALPDWGTRRGEILAGVVPAYFRNQATPILSRDGGAWLLVHSEAEIRRYDGEGRLLWSRILAVPEMDAARQAFFERNRREERPGRVHRLVTMPAAVDVGDELWILMQAVPEAPAAIYLLDRMTGDLLGRLTFDAPAPPTDLAVDRIRGKAYLAIFETASVLSIDIGTVPTFVSGER